MMNSNGRRRFSLFSWGFDVVIADIIDETKKNEASLWKTVTRKLSCTVDPRHVCYVCAHSKCSSQHVWDAILNVITTNKPKRRGHALHAI